MTTSAPVAPLSVISPELGRFTGGRFVGRVMASELLKRRALLAAYHLERELRAPGDPNRRLTLEVPRFECRYCGRKKPEVRFKTAHVLAEALGSRRIVSRFECTPCNEKFADCETDLVASLGAALALTGVEGKNRGKGKGRRPKYTFPGTNQKLYHNGRSVVVEYEVGREDVVFDPETRRLTLQAPATSYIPTRVFRALYKVAVAALPPASVRAGAMFACDEGYTHLVTAVNPHGPVEVRGYPALLLSHVLPGPPAPRTPHAKIDLLRRRSEPRFRDTTSGRWVLLPSRMLAIQFGIHVFQLPLFSDRDLTLLESEPEATACVVPYPLLVDRHDVERFGLPSSEIVDLSSPEPVEVKKRSIILQGVGEPVRLSAEASRELVASGRTPFD